MGQTQTPWRDDRSFVRSRLGEYDLSLNQHAYPQGPMAEGRGVYRVIGWEGSDRGGLLLSAAEADAIKSALVASGASTQEAR